ncbi:MAG: UvrD-helicase domain-containing protein [Spirochaetaceae bacterium]|jgi:ATP-dependent helicase/nuclease subunit A|nr:UvrD-helicase domain-containing protein [Spirochaetaceae bacterium]
MAIDDILEGLNTEQLEAVKTLSSVVVSAGAGSGKTKVLASRFAYLVMEGGLAVDEILTLTFTNKATNEMYGRIYGLLSEQNDEAARAAIRDFHKARIQTLDSFCAEVCALACARYGVKTDFTTDAEAAREMAGEAALSFVLDNRDTPGIKALIADNKIRDIADGLFAELVSACGSLSNPLSFGLYLQKQQEELAEKWHIHLDYVDEMAAVIKAELAGVQNTTTATYKNFNALFADGLDLTRPSIEALLTEADESSGAQKEAAREAFCGFLAVSGRINALRKVGNARGMEAIKEVHGKFKDAVYPELVKIAAMALNFDTVREVFILLDRFQQDFNRQKRLSGIMTFNDVAELALSILKNEPDIRKIYGEKIKAVMIDEFQDNNELQRELLFLAGGGGIFFVGDQKQSIYRFRGADVSVFRRLGREIEKSISLKINYRSNAGLIRAFNGIFSRIFPERSADVPDYEAEYEPLESASPEADGDGAGKIEICLFDKNALGADAECSAEDVEAAFAAEKIRRMVDGAYAIWDREAGKHRACRYDDFAVLERSVSHQHNLEKQFRAFGVPYNCENCAGLFLDAPANDIYKALRLLVYPKDKSAYAAVLRSPFARLGDETLALCMLKFSGVPFDTGLEGSLSETERAPYRRAGDMYRELLRGIRERNLSAAELVTKLWYDWGYRYDVLWSSEAQVYGDIYDYLFELARTSDAAGKTLAGFVDHLDALARKKEKLSDFDLPLERGQGVRIMTIHKSKGLEFPVVFIYGAGSHGQNVKNSGMAAYSAEWGVSLNLKGGENLSVAAEGNYFFDLTRETEKQKDEAELRRLLYVAMTRAEDTLVVSGIKNTKNTGVKSFLDLLKPVLDDEALSNGETESFSGDGPLFRVEEVAARTRAEIREAAARCNTGNAGGKKAVSMRGAAAAAREKYGSAELSGEAELFITTRPASLLDDEAGEPMGTGAAPRRSTVRGGGFFPDTALTPAEFGTLVHRVIEERFATGGAESAKLPLGEGEAEKLAARYAQVFFESEIGKKSLAATFRKTEFPFLSLYEEDGRKTYVSGVIDLLFDWKNEIYIVDYKTDRIFAPEKHYKQLAAYSDAAEALFAKKTHAALFYLREGRLAEYRV